MLESGKKLQKIENKALRCALNKDKFANIDALHYKAKLNRLSQRRTKQTVLFLHSLVAQALKWHGIFNNNRQVKTRSADKLMFRLKKPRTEKFKKCISSYEE